MDKQLTTAEQSVSKAKEEIINEAQRIEESALCSSKGHFAASSFWANFHLWLGIPMVVMAVIAGSSFIGDNNILGALLSLVIAILSGVITFLNPNQKSGAHLSAGNNYDALLNEVRILRTIDCWREDSEQILTERLKNFSSQKSKLNQSSPQIPWWAYQMAMRGVRAGEGSYEIDKKVRITASDQIPRLDKHKTEEKAVASPNE